MVESGMGACKSSCIFWSLVIIASALATPLSAAKSRRRPISDAEIKVKKDECYADIESGLWGWECKSSTTAKENCALQCLSPSCYELVYKSDPLEEGEKDLIRRQEYKYCMHKCCRREDVEFIEYEKLFNKGKKDKSMTLYC